LNSKSIKKVLHKKVVSWVNSIENEDLKKKCLDNVIVTGGSIVSLLTNEEVNDYDIYFKNVEVAKEVADYYIGVFKKKPPKNLKDSIKDIDVYTGISGDHVDIFVKSIGVVGDSNDEDFEDMGSIGKPKVNDNSKSDKYNPVFISSNAITLSNKIQLIFRFCGEAKDIHKNYDFVHCTCSFNVSTNELILPPEALESIINKELIYQGSLYPICSIFRTRKFINRGWFINAGQYLKMAWQISKLDLDNIHTLKDQLIGVDTTHFSVMISNLEKKFEDGENIDGGYLMNLIDEIF